MYSDTVTSFIKHLDNFCATGYAPLYVLPHIQYHNKTSDHKLLRPIATDRQGIIKHYINQHFLLYRTTY